MTIKVLLVDDQALFREGLHTLLSVHADLEVVGEAGNGEEALRLAASRLRHDRLIDAQAAFLDDAAGRWRQVQRLRAFLAAVEDRFAKAKPTAEIQVWLAWARGHCEELDPLSSPALLQLQAYAAALQSPPDLPPRHPEEAEWRDAGFLDEFLHPETEE